MKNKINTLYVFMILGILLSFIILFTGGGYYGMGNSFEAFMVLVITSVIIFFVSLRILKKEFQQNKKSITLWFLILISFPLTALGGIYLVQKSIYGVRTSMYRKDVRNRVIGDYLNAKIELKTFIENHIDWSKEDLGIERDMYEIEFSMMDTIFFSPNVPGEFAGLLVLQITTNDVFLDSLQVNGYLSKEDVLYIRNSSNEYKYSGFRFIYNRDLNYMYFFNNNSSNYATIEDCIDVLRESFLLNINSVSYWDYQDTGKKRFYFLHF
jgi:energy-coupling factor transporter transmembrane protein EcfT